MASNFLVKKVLPIVVTVPKEIKNDTEVTVIIMITSYLTLVRIATVYAIKKVCTYILVEN